MMICHCCYINTASFIYRISTSFADKCIVGVVVVVACIYLMISGTCHVIYSFQIIVSLPFRVD
jgi:hypothetical protein